MCHFDSYVCVTSVSNLRKCVILTRIGIDTSTKCVTGKIHELNEPFDNEYHY